LAQRASNSHAVRFGSRLAKRQREFDSKIRQSYLSSNFGKLLRVGAAARCYFWIVARTSKNRTDAWKIVRRRVAEKTMDLYTAVGVRLDRRAEPDRKHNLLVVVGQWLAYGLGARKTKGRNNRALPDVRRNARGERRVGGRCCHQPTDPAGR
jgi:hypothetical protein